MSNVRQRLPRSLEVIQRGRERGLHTGAQLYVSLRGEPVASAGIGGARPGVPMTPDILLRWMSAVKPVMAVAIGLLWEEDRLDLDDPVARFIPEFAVHGKEGVTLRHLLTHTGGIPEVDYESARTWDEVIALISASPLQPDWTPGRRAGYHPGSSWFVLGEVVRRLTGQAYGDFVRQRIFEPLAMNDSWVDLSAERYDAYGDRMGIIYDTKGREPVPADWQTADLDVPWPGGSGRGPVRELGRFYEMLLNRGRTDNGPLLRPVTVEALTARHRVRMLDQTFGFVYDWGLGFMLNSRGNQSVKELSYDFGAHASMRTFGHGGSQCAMGFCDPEHGLVVAWAFNGLPGEPNHRRRNHSLNTAIYDDLGLASNREEPTES